MLFYCFELMECIVFMTPCNRYCCFNPQIRPEVLHSFLSKGSNTMFCVKQHQQIAECL